MAVKLNEPAFAYARNPYGDFERVHQCALLAAESRAGQRKYFDIELAVAHLHSMLEALRVPWVARHRLSERVCQRWSSRSASGRSSGRTVSTTA